MVWLAISRRGTTSMKIYRCDKKERCNSASYIELLKSKLEEFNDIFPDEWILQQDNAPSHNAKATKKFMQDENIDLLYHPPLSPDLNPVEKVWAIMKGQV